MAIKFYTDEHVSPAVVNGLRQRGIDVLTAKEAGMLGMPDEKHLEIASTQGRVIFTQDSDFLRFHSKGINHHGIVYAHQRTPSSRSRCFGCYGIPLYPVIARAAFARPKQSPT